MPLLAIETTCDETAAAVIARSREVLSSVVASQEHLHARWRGVVPEVASRAHVDRIVPVIDQALDRSGLSIHDIEAVGVAVRPGLVGSLLVGLAAGKAIAAARGVPIVGYDHVLAHLYACRLARGEALEYPCVGLVASGGHTSLFRMDGPLEATRLGGTIDDAAGEAFDKAASLLGLGYPGGPEIEKAAIGGDAQAHRFPRPLAADRDRLDLSFSGLKTSLRYRVRPPGASGERPCPSGAGLADLAASFQRAVVDSIVAKVDLALEKTGCTTLAAGGGVAANTALREALTAVGSRRRVQVVIPPRALCTDNAAMGAIAWELLEGGHDDGAMLDVTPGTDRSAAARRA
ncbi:MAG: tRNA (adenosine(37)-N6)-threonylcarbamoyltransferase complex transferase subunit TsaD [Planctomycetes bacterium]|nr:tRNA (adenosine(37)-N6)-threonylcarbamoyltransferase complex transferase subunit TsaD [Planctomycetota bacterium]